MANNCFTSLRHKANKTNQGYNQPTNLVGNWLENCQTSWKQDTSNRTQLAAEHAPRRKKLKGALATMSASCDGLAFAYFRFVLSFQFVTVKAEHCMVKNNNNNNNSYKSPFQPINTFIYCETSITQIKKFKQLNSGWAYKKITLHFPVFGKTKNKTRDLNWLSTVSHTNKSTNSQPCSNVKLKDTLKTNVTVKKTMKNNPAKKQQQKHKVRQKQEINLMCL